MVDFDAKRGAANVNRRGHDRLRVVPGLTRGVIFAGCISSMWACNLILGTKEGSSPPTEDTGSPADGSGVDVADADSATVILTDSPPDVECPTPWNTNGTATGACAGRTTAAIAKAVIGVNTLSIARTAAGRIGIAYNSMFSFEEGHLEVALFSPTAPGFKPTTVEVAGNQFEDIGGTSRILAGSSGDFYVVYQALPDGLLEYRSVSGTGTFSPVQDLASGLGSRTSLTASISSKDDVRVAYFDPAAGNIASRMRSKAGQVGAPSIVQNASGADAGAPFLRFLSMAVDDTDSFHLAFAHGYSQGSTPRHVTFTGTFWSPPKTLDNQSIDGFAGQSVALAIAGQNKYAAYFYRAGTGSVAELRLASWTNEAGPATVTVVSKPFEAKFPNPLYRVAIAVDVWGLVHLAVITTTTGRRSLEYVRQTRLGGVVSWHTDVVQNDIATTTAGDAFVDLVVDAKRRPHIVYYAPVDGNVYYATKF